jgi:hypothetical protein
MDASGAPDSGTVMKVGSADELAETRTDVDGDGFRIVVKVVLGALGADGDGGRGSELEIDACIIDTCVDESSDDRDGDGLVICDEGDDDAAAAADCVVLLSGAADAFDDV